MTISLPVDEKNDKTDGLADLSLYRPLLYSTLRSKKISENGFGAWKTGENYGAWFAHDHLLYITSDEIDIPFAEEMLVAQLPAHLKKHTKKEKRKKKPRKTIHITKSKATVEDVMGMNEYIVAHREIDRKRYSEVWKTSGNFGQLPELENDITNISCQQEINLFLAFLFSIFTGTHVYSDKGLRLVEIGGVYTPFLLFTFLSEIVVAFYVLDVFLSVKKLMMIVKKIGRACRLHRSSFPISYKPLFDATLRHFLRWFWPNPRGPGPPFCRHFHLLFAVGTYDVAILKINILIFQ